MLMMLARGGEGEREREEGFLDEDSREQLGGVIYWLWREPVLSAERPAR